MFDRSVAVENERRAWIDSLDALDEGFLAENLDMVSRYSGSTPSFFRSTMLPSAARRARVRWASQLTVSGEMPA